MSSNTKKTIQDIEKVKSLIEQCLQLYMHQEEVIYYLFDRENIERAFTETVWHKLEEENPEFFKQYKIRLLLKQQIIAFNTLLEKQAELLGLPYEQQQNGAAPLLISDHSNTSSDNTVPEPMENDVYHTSSHTGPLVGDQPPKQGSLYVNDSFSRKGIVDDSPISALQTLNSIMGTTINPEHSYSNMKPMQERDQETIRTQLNYSNVGVNVSPSMLSTNNLVMGRIQQSGPGAISSTPRYPNVYTNLSSNTQITQNLFMRMPGQADQSGPSYWQERVGVASNIHQSHNSNMVLTQEPNHSGVFPNLLSIQNSLMGMAQLTNGQISSEHKVDSHPMMFPFMNPSMGAMNERNQVVVSSEPSYSNQRMDLFSPNMVPTPDSNMGTIGGTNQVEKVLPILDSNSESIQGADQVKMVDVGTSDDPLLGTSSSFLNLLGLAPIAYDSSSFSYNLGDTRDGSSFVDTNDILDVWKD